MNDVHIVLQDIARNGIFRNTDLNIYMTPQRIGIRHNGHWHMVGIILVVADSCIVLYFALLPIGKTLMTKVH